MLVLRQQRSRLHDHPVHAISTLHRLFVDERLLQGMQRAWSTQAFEGLDVAARNRPTRKSRMTESQADERTSGHCAFVHSRDWTIAECAAFQL
jgi:hypothetical protein